MDGPVIDSVGPVAEGQVVDFDVTGAVLGDGTYEFAIVGLSANKDRYASREMGATGPELILVLQ